MAAGAIVSQGVEHAAGGPTPVTGPARSTAHRLPAGAPAASPLSRLADLSASALGKPISMGVASVDGDAWDDAVIGTESGYITRHRHGRGSSWSVSPVDDLGKPICGLALGDAERGITLSYV